MYIDTHCHIQFEQFDEDRPMMIGNAKKADVKQFIVPGVDAFSSKKAIELSRLYPGEVFAAVGYHPYEASHNPDVPFLDKCLQFPVIAIGEIGLDYHLFKDEPALGKKQEQRILFERQLTLALRHDLPVIMHCRDAYEDFFTVLDSLPAVPRGVIHCFSGGLQEMRMAAERKLFVGVDGNITYAKQLQQIISQIPTEMLLLETDSPYLTPIPHRGLRNEPKNIPLVAEKIAQLKNIPQSEVESRTTENARLLFSVSSV
jgi:TatD DNase family protein